MLAAAFLSFSWCWCHNNACVTLPLGSPQAYEVQSPAELGRGADPPLPPSSIFCSKSWEQPL